MALTQEEVLALLSVGEDVDCEFKEAATSFPSSFWSTYSAFANTSGGTIVLGVKESHGSFEVTGVHKPESRRKELWDQLQNREKVSSNVLQEDDVAVMEVEGKQLLVVHVPQAGRQQRPVFISGNPLRGTFKRNYEGDYRCQESEVRSMLREASDEVFDTAVREEFSLSDLDDMAITAYRNRLRARDADHPWLSLGDRELVEKLGGWRRDRARGAEGPTQAGILMFGRESAIAEAFPHFCPDYQEQLSEVPDTRWTHRITPDGRWEPNLFNFYTRVISRLTVDLEVPFVLDKDLTRQGQTHVHEALREALVNCLIHADHASTRPILIIRRRNDFIFRNPGRPRIPLEQVYSGGLSDCRNPSLQKMFFMMGAGERAGSGIGKILRAWSEQHWLMPLIRDLVELEITECWLSTVSMFPPPVLNEIARRVGDDLATAERLEMTALVMAQQYGSVTNADLQRFSPEHPIEIGKALRGLVNKGWLSRHERGRATRYTLADKTQAAPEPWENLESGAQTREPGTGQSAPEMQHKPPGIQHSEANIQHKPPDIQHNGANIQHGAASGHSDVAATGTPSDEWGALVELALPVRSGKRVSPETVDRVVLDLCTRTPLTARQIAVLIGREPSTVAIHYLPRLLRAGLLQLLYPSQPRRRDQAYVAEPRPSESTAVSPAPLEAPTSPSMPPSHEHEVDEHDPDPH